MPTYFNKLPAIGQSLLKLHNQWGQIVLHDGPENIKINLVVTMDQAVAQAGNLHPGHIEEYITGALRGS